MDPWIHPSLLSYPIPSYPTLPYPIPSHPISFFICPSIHPTIYPSICLYIYPAIRLPRYPLSTHPSIAPSLRSIYPSSHLSIYRSVRLSIDLSTYPSIHYFESINVCIWYNPGLGLLAENLMLVPPFLATEGLLKRIGKTLDLASQFILCSMVVWFDVEIKGPRFSDTGPQK